MPHIFSLTITLWFYRFCFSLGRKTGWFFSPCKTSDQVFVLTTEVVSFPKGWRSFSCRARILPRVFRMRSLAMWRWGIRQAGESGGEIDRGQSGHGQSGQGITHVFYQYWYHQENTMDIVFLVSYLILRKIHDVAKSLRCNHHDWFFYLKHRVNAGRKIQPESYTPAI